MVTAMFSRYLGMIDGDSLRAVIVYGVVSRVSNRLYATSDLHRRSDFDIVALPVCKEFARCLEIFKAEPSAFAAALFFVHARARRYATARQSGGGLAPHRADP